MNATRLAHKAVHWFLMVIIGFFLVTGFGISEFRIVERVTFGLLTKQLAFRIHSELWLPLVVLLVLHLYLVFRAR
jgi:cytochrome b subunit of formate dehydrogenase